MTKYKHPFKLNIHQKERESIEMYQIWLNIWCSSFCENNYEISMEPSFVYDYQLTASFENKNEAAMFKVFSDQYGIDFVA